MADAMQTLGQIAYESYCAARNWKSYTAERLPTFEEMKSRQPEIAQAWETAAEAVSRHVALQALTG